VRPHAHKAYTRRIPQRRLLPVLAKTDPGAVPPHRGMSVLLVEDDAVGRVAAMRVRIGQDSLGRSTSRAGCPDMAPCSAPM
jgi:alkylation response protein AidB-like acyl-CoA dehydrogenase